MTIPCVGDRVQSCSRGQWTPASGTVVTVSWLTRNYWCARVRWDETPDAPPTIWSCLESDIRVEPVTPNDETTARHPEMQLANTIDDAIRAAIEAGCTPEDARRVARILGRDNDQPTDRPPKWFESAVEFAGETLHARSAPMRARGIEHCTAVAKYTVQAFLRRAAEHGCKLLPEEEENDR